MPRKGFRHQRLLDVKSLLVTLRAVAMHRSEDQHQRERRRLDSKHEEKQDHLSRGSPDAVEGERSVIPQELQINAWYTEQLNEDLRRQILEVQLAESEAREKREQVERSAREKRTLERLREQQNMAARLDEVREEQRDLDEIASRLRGRRVIQRRL